MLWNFANEILKELFAFISLEKKIREKKTDFYHFSSFLFEI